MKKHFKTFLKGLFLTSAASIATSANAGQMTVDYDLSKLKSDDNNLELTPQKDNSQKFILKIQSDDSYLNCGA